MLFIGDSAIDIPVVTTEETSCVVGSSTQIGCRGSMVQDYLPFDGTFLKMEYT